jgi:hypothetical protein
MKAVMLLLSLCGALSTAAALQWPMEEAELLSGFGSPSGPYVSTGMELTGEKGIVRPCQEGEIIYIARSEDGGSLSEKGIVVLEHDNGFRSCYGLIEPAKDLDSRSYLNEGDILGEAPEGLLFSIRDSKLNRWVNPFNMFSVRDDDISPEVEEVLLRRKETSFPLSEESSPPAGTYRLLVKISDRVGREGVPLLPYSVKIRYLGQTLFALSLDSLSHQDGKAYFEGAGKIAAQGLFSPEGYLDGGEIIINQGKGLIEVELTDYKGNRTLRSFSLNRR